MKKFAQIVLPLVVMVAIVVISGFGLKPTDVETPEVVRVAERTEQQTVNLVVSHGHCSTPFAGVVDDLKVETSLRVDGGNPLEGMAISFEINPYSFKVCRGDDLTARIQTPGLFIGAPDENITFRTTNVYTMGLDWYQVNGMLSIKGVEREVTLFATGIRAPKETWTTLLVLQGRMDLMDWGIDYDKIVTGTSNAVPTKWMYINMKIVMS